MITGRRRFLGTVGAALSGLGVGRGGGGRPSSVHHLTILHTADLHGQVSAHDEMFWENDAPVFRRRGGIATLHAMINTIRREAPGRVLLVEGGDCLHGSGVTSLSEGHAIVPLINELGYDVLLPGNWEVVFGKAALLRSFAAYRGAAVCANMFHADPRPARLLFPPWRVIDAGGIRVGFIGYNDPLTPIRQSPAYSRGIRFGRPEESLARYVRILRQEERCALVFVVAHLGLAQQLHLANQPAAEGVDYILGGDTHERLREPLVGRHARVTEPGAFGSFLGRLDLVVEGGRIKEERYRLLDVDPERYAPDPRIVAMVTAARAPYAPDLDRVIGRTTTPLCRYFVLETPLDNLITDALMWRFGTDLVVSNGFRFCPPLVPGPDGAADISRDYLWSMLPVDSEVRRGRVTGAQIRAWLERELENVFSEDAAKRFGGWFVRYQGMKVTFRIRAGVGNRIQEILIGGQPLDPARRYSMLACEREGDPGDVLCRMIGVQDPRRVDVRLHDVMIEYLGRFSPVAPVVEGRAVALDGPPSLLSQLTGTPYRFQ